MKRPPVTPWPLLLLLAGCVPAPVFPYVKLLDQRSFSTVPTVQAKDLPAPPLAIIRFGAGAAEYAAALAATISATQLRRPNAEYNVLTAVAPGQSPDAQMTRNAVDIARAIAEQTVPTERIHIGVIEDAGADPLEIRVTLR